MNSHSITDLREPTAAQDATTKNYVDSSIRPAFSALGTSQTSPQGGKIMVEFDLILINAGSMFDSKLSRFKPKKRGAYFVNVCVIFNSLHIDKNIPVSDYNVFLHVNGDLFREIASAKMDKYKTNNVTSSLMVKMTETDYMEIYVNSEKDVKFIP